MRGGVLSLGVLLTGCSTLSVDGTIDGLPVPFEVSMFVEQPDALGGDDAMRVVFSSLLCAHSASSASELSILKPAR